MVVVVVVVAVVGLDAAKACPFGGLRSRVTAFAVVVVAVFVVLVVVGGVVTVIFLSASLESFSLAPASSEALTRKRS